MADAEEQRRLDELISDANFPMPGPEDLDLDFAYDFDADRTNRLSWYSPAQVQQGTMLNQQSGAIAALATQGAAMGRISSSDPKFFLQDGQMLQDGWDLPSLAELGTFADPNTTYTQLAMLIPQASAWGGSMISENELSGQIGPSQAQQPTEMFMPQAREEFGESRGITRQESGLQLGEQSLPHQESGSALSVPDSADSSELNNSDLASMSKAERVKAKNKRAQKKFRQKQKERHEELERSIVELSERLRATTAELDALQSQKQLLEISLSKKGDLSDSAGTEAQEVDEEPVFVPAQGFESFSSTAGILLEVVFDPPRRLSHAQAARLSLRDHAKIWKEQCRQANELLQNGAADEESPANKKLRALMNERHGLSAWTSVNNPIIMHKLMTSNLDDPPLPDHDPPEPPFWQEILGALQLTSMQQSYLLGARSRYLAGASRLLEARQGLQAKLKACAIARNLSVGLVLDTGFKSATGEKARAHAQWADTVKLLQENVDAFQMCHNAFVGEVYDDREGFTMLQEAGLMVKSFPRAPDVFALLKELAGKMSQHSSSLQYEVERHEGEEKP